MYAEFTVSQKQRTFLECHIHAFEKLGVPEKIRYDNTKTVVISRDKITKEPFFNFDLVNFARYYRFEPEACKPYYPQSKGKVEAGVKYLRNNFMNGKNLKKTKHITIEELNHKLWQWLDGINYRLHPSTNEKPFERWQKERPYLKMINDIPKYQNYSLSSRKASKISMVTYKRSSYWVPPEFAGKKIGIKEIENSGIVTLEFYYHSKKIIEWPVALKLGSWIVPKDDEVLLGSKMESKKKQSRKSHLWNTEVDVRDLSYYNQFINC